MTEEEAKTKWCPFARVGTSAISGFGALNRDVYEGGYSTRHSRCIASACMAWRWAPHETFRDAMNNAPKQHGFCGLAGAPR